MVNIDRNRIQILVEREQELFVRRHPKSKALFERGRASLLAGVPMNWMVRWPGAFPIFIEEARGAHITDVDGNKYLDLCLGDTGSMFGHSPKAVVDAINRQVERGITTMLPTEDSIWVGEELSRRFGLPYWQIAMTATDANRFSIRLLREITGRKKILVFNGCYHGSVDEALIDIRNGKTVARAGNIGPPVDLSLTTKAIEFNDVEALERALLPGDVACVLCEPAMTNRGIILPDDGYHDALREITQKYGTFLIIDETHTICCGPGGYTMAHGLEPDIVTMGKPLASGIPAAAYGISQELADKSISDLKKDSTDESGIGGTLSGNPLAVAAMRATLEKVITKEAFDYMIPLAKRFSEEIENIIEEKILPWHVIRLGVRIEYKFRPTRPRNGTEAAEGADSKLDRLMHLMALNRGILLTPFHNMALISPATTEKDVDHHTDVFRDSVNELIGDS